MKIKLLLVIACGALFYQGAAAQTSSAGSGENSNERNAIMKKNDGRWLDAQLQNIAETERQVKDYNPMRKGYLASSAHDRYLLPAVSAAARREFLQDAPNLSASDRDKLAAALDRLAVAVAGKLPEYRIDLDVYAERDAAAETLVKNALPDAERLTIYEIGFKQAFWQTALQEGRAVARFKNAAVRARRSGDDHPYCWLFYVRLSENPDERDAKTVKAEMTTKLLVECPR